ncbi:MAG: hypothetical protein QM714_14970 [Nocardioides sp.]|uniref:hypothetical protein n=1 Tax=Nocardioides sp. TaxID=35761 RepID=UPI0039E58EB3
MSWDDRTPYLEELAAGIHAFVQPEGERVVCNIYCSYVELTDFEAPFPLIFSTSWPEMVELHGGPIVSHA